MSLTFNSAPYWLDPENIEQAFPDVSLATREPNGLLAIGGDLSPVRLLNAYRKGIFPWFDKNQPILWWSPNPRAVLFPNEIRISRSLRKTLKKNRFTLRFDNAFDDVINACSQPRQYSDDTWIDPRIKSAYTELHRLGYAHSSEAWLDGELVGGLYGVAIGRVFYGESMFYRETDASKIAFVNLVNHLQQWQYELIDCQMTTNHLVSLGAKEISRNEFSLLIEKWCQRAAPKQAWEQANGNT